METLQGLVRSHYCGHLRLEDVDKEVVLMGWVQKTRDLGSLCFVDLRDREGICQLAFSDQNNELYEKAKSLRSEYVIAVKGKVVERTSKNPDLPTGDVEILCSTLRVLEKAETPPIYIKDDDDVAEEKRLRYRYLDLRKPKMQKMLKDRAKLTKLFRDFLYEEGFIEVETPFLGKPTPEGARDYLVPSRVNAGKFYALPQSPQLMKQLLMIGGTDRYYQVARCFRDEDLRANRQPEFTQVDIEMSFVDMEDVIDLNERLICHLFKEFKGIELERPFPRMTYREAMDRYGSDKPDLRFGFTIQEITDIASLMEFDLFSKAKEKGEGVFAIHFQNMAGKYSRKKLDKLADYTKGIGASGLLWVKLQKDSFSSSFNKFMTKEAEDFFLEKMEMKNEDLVCIMVGEKEKTLSHMGALRVNIAQEQVEFKKDHFAITWIVDFPLFEYDEEEERLDAIHHPFTAPKDEDLELLDKDPLKIRSKAYDIVINGDECGGGSIRIHQSDLQKKIFECLHLSKSDIEERFGFFTEALKYGTPPHGGIAYGFDRFLMMMTNEDNIRDVIAFPKTQSATDLMTDAPSLVEKKQTQELHIKLDL